MLLLHTFSNGQQTKVCATSNGQQTKVCATLLLLLALPLAGGEVSGKVKLVDSRDAAVKRKLDYSGVVLWLDPVDAAPKAPQGTARMLQRDKQFTPHVLAVSVGTTVEFPNFDPIFHNAFSNYDGQVFDIGLYPPGTTRKVHFTRPGIVRIFCNIHASMTAVIVVVNTQWLTTSGKDGSFAIPDVKPGAYTLRVFHERATPATLKALERRVTVGNEGQALPAMSISESGYLPLPHLNKYGQEYPPAPDESGAYPVIRK